MTLPKVNTENIQIRVIGEQLDKLGSTLHDIAEAIE